MAHYALLDEDNVVIELLTGRDEDDLVEGVSNWEEYYGDFHNKKCLRYSYNTFGGVHRLGGQPFRKNCAMIGGTYSEELDAFINIKPFESWILNEETCVWESPVPMPTTPNKTYAWNESTLTWDEVTEQI